MARFYGTVQGNRGRATRLGHTAGGLRVTAQTWSATISVELRAQGDEDHVMVRAASNEGSVCLYYGPIKQLFDKDWQHALVRQFAEQQLKEQREKGE